MDGDSDNTMVSADELAIISTPKTHRNLDVVGPTETHLMLGPVS